MLFVRVFDLFSFDDAEDDSELLGLVMIPGGINDRVRRNDEREEREVTFRFSSSAGSGTA